MRKYWPDVFWICALLFFCLWIAGLLFGAQPNREPMALEFPPRTGLHLVYAAEAIDGDTVRFYWLVADVGRLHGINAPELRDPAGQAAKAHLAKLLPGRPTKAKIWGRDKYGRALLELHAGEKSLGQLMIEAGHAKPWDGKGARP